MDSSWTRVRQVAADRVLNRHMRDLEDQQVAMEMAHKHKLRHSVVERELLGAPPRRAAAGLGFPAQPSDLPAPSFLRQSLPPANTNTNSRPSKRHLPAPPSLPPRTSPPNTSPTPLPPGGTTIEEEQHPVRPAPPPRDDRITVTDRADDVKTTAGSPVNGDCDPDFLQLMADSIHTAQLAAAEEEEEQRERAAEEEKQRERAAPSASVEEKEAPVVRPARVMSGTLRLAPPRTESASHDGDRASSGVKKKSPRPVLRGPYMERGDTFTTRLQNNNNGAGDRATSGSTKREEANSNKSHDGGGPSPPTAPFRPTTSSATKNRKTRAPQRRVSATSQPPAASSADPHDVLQHVPRLRRRSLHVEIPREAEGGNGALTEAHLRRKSAVHVEFIDRSSATAQQGLPLHREDGGFTPRAAENPSLLRENNSHDPSENLSLNPAENPSFSRENLSLPLHLLHDRDGSGDYGSGAGEGKEDKNDGDSSMAKKGVEGKDGEVGKKKGEKKEEKKEEKG